MTAFQWLQVTLLTREDINMIYCFQNAEKPFFHPFKMELSPACSVATFAFLSIFSI